MYGAFLLFEAEFLHVVAITFTSLILTELLMVGLTVRTWHFLMIVSEILSLLIYVASIFILRDIFGKFNVLKCLKVLSRLASAFTSVNISFMFDVI